MWLAWDKHKFQAIIVESQSHTFSQIMYPRGNIVLLSMHVELIKHLADAVEFVDKELCCCGEIVEGSMTLSCAY